MSVDGFVAGPNDETDWMFPSMSDGGRAWVIELFESVGLQLIGRKVYEDWAGFWPTSPIPMARYMNEIPKVVFSSSGEIDLAKIKVALDGAQTPVDPVVRESWLNPIVAGKDLVADIQRLKAQDGKPILAQGGNSFAASLIAANLVDVIHLAVHPVAIGRGYSLFGGLEAPMHLKLEGVKQFETGAMVKTYRPA